MGPSRDLANPMLLFACFGFEWGAKPIGPRPAWKTSIIFQCGGRAMFLSDVLLFAGGFLTTLFAISVICPVPKNQPITGC
jgi:hypothetical protein